MNYFMTGIEVIIVQFHHYETNNGCELFKPYTDISILIDEFYSLLFTVIETYIPKKIKYDY